MDRLLTTPTNQQVKATKHPDHVMDRLLTADTTGRTDGPGSPSCPSPIGTDCLLCSTQTQHFQSASSEAWRNDAQGDSASLVASVGCHLSIGQVGGVGWRPCLPLVCSDALTCGDEASHGFIIRWLGRSGEPS